MATSYSEELVQIQAADGVELVGAVIRPANPRPNALPIVWVHGFTGSFCESHAIKIGRRLAERGHVFVTGNNRGHDFGAILPIRETPQQRLGGAAWEMLGESPLDVDAWIGFATGLGVAQVALVGHSLGGMKSTYYLATREDPRVKAFVNASGPVWRFIGPAPEAVARLPEAQQMVEAGRGLELLPPFTFEGTSGVSAQTVVGGEEFRAVIFGDQDRPPAVALLRLPLLTILGSEESWLGVPADLDWVKATARSAPRCDTAYIQGADHVYTGHTDEVADIIADWVGELG